jgi:hypothetical protein
MNTFHIEKVGIFKILTFASIILFSSTSSLAEINQTEKVYIHKGYPYEGLVDRSEAVEIFYKELADNISCRVEVLQNGQIWKSEERSISLKKFTKKPLRSCMDRVDAKKLLANTF